MLSHNAYNAWQVRTLHALRKCRTAALGGHIDQCNDPSRHRLHLSYNSCRNRHCPKCQGYKSEQWIRAREEELLNVPYFHVVFTIPQELNRLCLHRPELMYNLLFKTAWQTIKGFSSNDRFLGANSGMIAILHTWGPEFILASTSAQHCSGRWDLKIGQMEIRQEQRKIPVSRKGDGQGIQGSVCGRAAEKPEKGTAF